MSEYSEHVLRLWKIQKYINGHGHLINTVYFYNSELKIIQKIKWDSWFDHRWSNWEAKPWMYEFCIIRRYFHRAKNRNFSTIFVILPILDFQIRLVLWYVMLTFTKNSDSSLEDISLAWMTKKSELKMWRGERGETF